MKDVGEETAAEVTLSLLQLEMGGKRGRSKGCPSRGCARPVSRTKQGRLGDVKIPERRAGLTLLSWADLG